MLLKDFNWTEYSLARINLVASNRGNCSNVLPKSNDATLQAFREALKGNLTEDDRLLLEVYDRLSACQGGTLGAELWRYYQENSHTPVSPQGTFPVRYIMIHDAHHVLLNTKTDDQGELNVLAFECGMISGGQKSESLIPVLSQTRAFPDCDIPQMARFWECGCKARPGLLETWDLSSAIDRPIEEIKYEYAITI